MKVFETRDQERMAELEQRLTEARRDRDEAWDFLPVGIHIQAIKRRILTYTSVDGGEIEVTVECSFRDHHSIAAARIHSPAESEIRREAQVVELTENLRRGVIDDQLRHHGLPRAVSVISA